MHEILIRIPLPFTDKTLPLFSYGFMLMLGFLSALLVARWRGKTIGLSPDHVTDMALAALIGGIVGSRLAYVIQYGNASFLDFFKLWEGGLVFYGGFIGACVLVIALLKTRKQRLLPFLDATAPSLALGHALGRIGCLMKGCCYGRPVPDDAWYGIEFPPSAPAYPPPGREAVWPFVPPHTHLFPTQIVSTIDLLIIFGLLSLYFKRRKGAGEVIGLYLVLYSVHRFVIEFFRYETHRPGVLSSAQWISFGMFFVGLGLWGWVRGSSPTDATHAA